jgi:Flp pilus assembly protein TadG
MMRKAITKRSRQKGASATEFALILPVLILILFAIVELGIIFYNKAVITNASREGARVGITYHPDPRLPYADIDAAVNNYTSSYLITFGADSGPQIVTTPSAPTEISSGQDVIVDVTYQYDFLLLPNFVSSLSDGITLRAITTMRAE